MVASNSVVMRRLVYREINGIKRDLSDAREDLLAAKSRLRNGQLQKADTPYHLAIGQLKFVRSEIRAIQQLLSFASEALRSAELRYAMLLKVLSSRTSATECVTTAKNAPLL
jgi:hypothetical protein